MIRPFSPRVLVALLFFILAYQTAAVSLSLYFHYWWLDIPIHILGGLWITLFFLATYYASPRTVIKDHSNIFVISFATAVTLTVGLCWEIYEFAIAHAIGDFGIGLADSLKDLVDDLIGALLGALIFIRGKYHENT